MMMTKNARDFLDKELFVKRSIVRSSPSHNTVWHLHTYGTSPGHLQVTQPRARDTRQRCEEVSVLSKGLCVLVPSLILSEKASYNATMTPYVTRMRQLYLRTSSLERYPR